MDEQRQALTGDPRELIEEAIEMTREERFEEAIEIFEAHLTTLSGGELEDKRAAAAAFSYYGLCVAMARRKYSDGVRYCQISIRSNSYEPEHHYNLAQIYVFRDDRRHAIKALKAGLRLSPRHKEMNKVYDELGRRRPPTIPFLSRDNPLNVWLGRQRKGGSEE